jgi:hypothetical protein
MAEIVQSLFGVSPEMYQQRQDDIASAHAMQFAKLDPFQQANYAIGRGAYGLAGALGGALGGQDPELQRITMRQQIASQLNPNDPASIQQAISALMQAGDTQGGMMLQGEYRKLQESGALVAQRNAAAARDAAAAGRERAPATTNEITNARALALRSGVEGSPEYIAAFNTELQKLTTKPERAEARSEIQKLLDERDALDPVKDKKRYDDLQARIGILTTRSDQRPQVSVKVSGSEQETSFEKEIGKKQADAIFKSKDGADSAAISLQTMSQAKDLLSKPMFSGPTADFQAQFGSLLQSAGVKLDTDSVANTQAYGALMARQTAEIIKSFGAGTGLSDADREYALKAAGGNVRMDKESLKRIVNINETAARNVIILHNKKVKGIKTNIPLEVQLPSTGWRIAQ